MIETAAKRSIGSLTSWLSGGTPSRSRTNYWRGDIPWISAFTLKGAEVRHSDQHLTAEAVAVGSKMAPLNATLLLVRGSALHNEIRAGLVVAPVAFNQDVKALVPKSGVVPKYLTHAIRGNESALLKLVTSAGNTAGVLDTKVVQSFEIYFPAGEEQSEIVRVLDDIDSLVASLEKLIVKKQAIKQGMMQQLLTGKTRLPGFTSEWVETLLGDHVLYVKTVALSRAELDTVSPLRYLHYGDIHTSDNVRLDAAHEEMPRAAAVKARNAGRLQVGDLVFADASEDPDGVGKSIEVVSIPASGVVPGLHTIAARFDKTVLVDGFKAYLQFIPGFRDALLRLASGTKVLATTRKYISSVALRLPEVAEQRAIAVTLQDADAEIATLERQLETVRNIKQGMMQELLTGRTRLLLAELAT